MLGAAEDLRHAADLLHLAAIHHDHAIAGLSHDRQIVSDQQDRTAGPLLFEFQHQVQDLGLGCDIQGGRRFIGDQQLRITAQGDGNHRSLQHTARKLVGILCHPSSRVGNAYPLQHFDRPLGGLLPAHLRMVRAEGLDDLKADGEHGVERRHGLLKNHRDFIAADLPHFRERFPQQIRPGVEDFAPRVKTGGIGDQPQDGQRGDAFARARFADQAQHFSPGSTWKETPSTARAIPPSTRK